MDHNQNRSFKRTKRKQRSTYPRLLTEVQHINRVDNQDSAPEREPDEDWASADWSPFPVNSAPMEMAPVIRNVLDYGRRTYQLGMTRAIKVLERLQGSVADANAALQIENELAELRRLAKQPVE